jgi:hypothetical protein
VGNRSLVDAVLSTNLTPNLTLILNADVGQQENMTPAGGGALVTEQYHGVAGYLNYKWSDPLHTSLRVERFIDQKGVLVSYSGQVGVSEMTFTVGYTVNDHFEVRGELRGDRADKAIYSGTGTTMYQTLTTAGIQALYRF